MYRSINSRRGRASPAGARRPSSAVVADGEIEGVDTVTHVRGVRPTAGPIAVRDRVAARGMSLNLGPPDDGAPYALAPIASHDAPIGRQPARAVAV
jgi:hypothetical protein